MENRGNIDVIIEDFTNHPHCPHGPTILFSRRVKGEKKNFFACAAYRERKHCNFFVWEHDKCKLTKFKKGAWEQETKKLLNNINHRKKYVMLNKVNDLPPHKRIYCNTCSMFVFDGREEKHVDHKLLKVVTDYELNHPSEILPSLEDTTKEAQYLFSKSTVKTLVNIFQDLKYKKVICVGTPRLHEYIRYNCKDMDTILLDIDSRFHNFFGPLEYCWHNMFNNHFFFNEAKDVFKDFLSSSKDGIVLVTDPPFGGRIEPLAYTFSKINNEYKSLNNVKDNLPIFWIFPYFMEPQILNSLPNYRMMDYKVEYDNHASFSDGRKGRKYGSPVRIFTNISLGLVKLPEDNYKFCKPCNRWVSKENLHCSLCKACPSKDGRTYVHCSICNRCVKPTWRHCDGCKRCSQIDHKCGLLEFSKDCFHCKEPGHKRSECPQLKTNGSDRKRKIAKREDQKRKCYNK